MQHKEGSNVEERTQDKEHNLLEVDLVSPQEGKEVSTNEVSGDSFENVFTRERYKTEKEVVGSYDALNGNFMLIDDIRNDFSRMSNPTEIMTLQKELKKILPNFDIDVDGRFTYKTEKALREYEQLLNLM